jgi:hypothetical protein
MHDMQSLVPYFLNLCPGQKAHIPDCQFRNWTPGNPHFICTYTALRLSSNKDRHYRGADKSLVRPTSRFILFDGENISFDASLVIYMYIYIYIHIYIVLIFLQL